MILDKIIELELEYLRKNRIPTRILLSITNFNLLVKELEQDRYLEYLHNMKIEIVNSNQLIVL